MDLRNFGVLVLSWLYFFLEAAAVNRQVALRRGLLVYKTISAAQGSCKCSMPFSCSCCQRVMILYTKREKDLCVNFTYQRNGLNVDVTLSSDMINTRTVADYKAFQFCVSIPGCLFSNACINILELNRFPRSITACLRLDIYAKRQLWQINYDCVSILTELPMISGKEASMNGNGRTGGPSLSESTTTTVSTETTTAAMSELTTEEMIEMTERTDGMTETTETNTGQTGQMTVD